MKHKTKNTDFRNSIQTSIGIKTNTRKHPKIVLSFNGEHRKCLCIPYLQGTVPVAHIYYSNSSRYVLYWVITKIHIQIFKCMHVLEFLYKKIQQYAIQSA